MLARQLTALLAIATIGSSAGASASRPQRWGGAWGYATSPASDAARDVLPAGTYRYRLRSSQSGDGLRLVFTNPAGAVPLEIGRIWVAKASSDTGFGLQAATVREVALPKGTPVSIGAGQSRTMPAVDLAVAAGDDLIVSVTTRAPSTTVGGNAGFPVAFSEAAMPDNGAGLSPRKLRPFVTQLVVRNPAAACTIVTIGDSITEGARGTRTGWRGWPGELARRLIDQKGAHCGVVNMGISGNRLLRDGRGTAAVDRFDRDVASVPNVTFLIVLEGINDIWRAKLPGEPAVGASDLISGYRRIIDAAHRRNIRVIGGTMTPGWGSKYLTSAMEQVRQDTNGWIRTPGNFDAVIDFEAAIGSSETMPTIKPPFDSGDHLHPGDAGYEAMGQAVPLTLFPVPRRRDRR